jgi:predicted metal-binding transcription factor (methanogenesis marker protein 9)
MSKGVALSDILHQLHLTFIQVKEINLKNKTFLLRQMADIEHRLSLGSGEDIQLGALVGVCQIVRNSVAA